MKDNKVEMLKCKLESAKELLHKNSKVKYMAFTFVFFGGILFFLTSNMIFNKDADYISTALNTPISYENIAISINERSYNTDSGFLKFVVSVENRDKDKNYITKFELRSKDNPNELIPVNAYKVTDKDYVVIAEMNKKWSYLSLSVNLESEKDIKEIAGPFKIYSSIKDTNIDNSLVQKSNKEYFIEIVDRDILNIQSDISLMNTNIESNNKKIENLKADNIKLEEDKKYQIEEEIKNTNSQISSNNAMIENLKKDNEKAKEQIKNLGEKISKLEIKKSDYLTGNSNEE